VKATATNVKTGEKRELSVPMDELERTVYDSVDLCSGPCECTVEPDGECEDGWQSRLLTLGLI